MIFQLQQCQSTFYVKHKLPFSISIYYQCKLKIFNFFQQFTITILNYFDAQIIPDFTNDSKLTGPLFP